MIMIGD